MAALTFDLFGARTRQSHSEDNKHMQTHHDVPFNTLTTLKVGGTARDVVDLETEEECARVFGAETSPFFILGGGSNVLAPDGEYNGTVYRVGLTNIVHTDNNDGTVTVTAGAGASWDALVAYVVSWGWWGFENLSAIPGTVGGAVFQNIGAYGAVLEETIHSVRVYDTQEKEIRVFNRAACAFNYRTSIFKETASRYVILSATFTLTKDGKPNTTYKDVREFFKERLDGGSSLSLHEIRDAVIAIRARKFPDMNTLGTAGSFFLNPIVSKSEALRFQKRFPDMPLFTLPEGGIKLPLAWILDHVIHVKGVRVGGAFVWEGQPLAIVTEEGATANDVHALKDMLVQNVFDEVGIRITPEVRVISEK